jgi:hypothetical protein
MLLSVSRAGKRKNPLQGRGQATNAMVRSSLRKKEDLGEGAHVGASVTADDDSRQEKQELRYAP